MSETADILIIGGGVMGASIAYHLAKERQGKVVLLERQAICTGTTGRSGAIVRQHYSNEFSIRMAMKGLTIFQHFDALVGGDCGFVTTGMIVMIDEQGADALRANVQMQQEQGVDTCLLEPGEVAEAAPGYSSEGVALACYEPDAGVADPMATTTSLAQRAREYGATIYEGTLVTSILTDGERVTGVETTRGRVDAPIVTLAANVWSAGLASPLGITLPITATRHPMIALRRPNDYGGRLGMHAVGLDLMRDIYLRPDLGGITLVGSSQNVFKPSNPDDYAQGLSEAEIAHFRARANGSIPALARAVPRGGWAGIYDDTPDFHPILDRLAPYDGLYCAAGFSGHGFKLSPVIGQWMAHYILTGQKPDDMHHFAYDRFARGAEIRPRYSSGVLG
ncbi:MAG TPA: FAD-binding oxidoreductase [Ktedonobacteraceae bacterium]|nr:FAD-binding oxidoreductase [Ktedonobacteraceae bacterium]